MFIRNSSDRRFEYRLSVPGASMVFWNRLDQILRSIIDDMDVTFVSTTGHECLLAFVVPDRGYRRVTMDLRAYAECYTAHANDQLTSLGNAFSSLAEELDRQFLPNAA
jgi:hypothetical protein